MKRDHHRASLLIACITGLVLWGLLAACASPAGPDTQTIAAPVISPNGAVVGNNLATLLFGTPTNGEKLAVTITCPTSSATIRYTLDGSAPTASSPQYSAPLSLSKTTTVRAAAFVDATGSTITDASFSFKHATQFKVMTDTSNGYYYTTSYDPVSFNKTGRQTTNISGGVESLGNNVVYASTANIITSYTKYNSSGVETRHGDFTYDSAGNINSQEYRDNSGTLVNTDALTYAATSVVDNLYDSVPTLMETDTWVVDSTKSSVTSYTVLLFASDGTTLTETDVHNYVYARDADGFEISATDSWTKTPVSGSPTSGTNTDTWVWTQY